MHSEDYIPYEQRFLMIEGWVSSEALASIRSGLPEEWPATSRVVWVSFAYADVPLGRKYGIVFRRGRPQEGVPCCSQIIAATQQFGRPFDLIPRGWKSICVVDFPEGLPELIEEMPTVDGWFENEEWLGLCDEFTWDTLKRT